MVIQKQNKTPTQITKEAMLELRPEHPFFKNYDKISYFDKFNTQLSVPSSQKKINVIRVALVSLNISEDDLNDKKGKIYNQKFKQCPEFTDDDSCKRVIRHHRNENELLENYKKALNLALERYEADIICINELGFPTKNKKPSRKAVVFTKKMVHKHKSIIIAGSCHDLRTWYNTGHVYCPHDENCKYYYYHKQVSAKGVGELVSVSANRKSILVSTTNFTIGIIICLDLLDYSSIAPLIDHRNGVHFIFIPSFTDNMTPMRKVALQLSEVLPGGVAIVNRYTEEGEAHPSSLFIFGKKLKRKHNKSIKKPGEMPRLKLEYPYYYEIYSIGRNKGKIIIHDIFTDLFHSTREEIRNKGNQNLKWLFGLPTHQRQIGKP